MIETLPDRIAALPAQIERICERMLYVDSATGYTDPPPNMEPWIVQHFGAIEQVRRQTIIKVTNRLTLESALFNPIRARRPTRSSGLGDRSEQDAKLERTIAQELAEHDIFHDPERSTTADLFGRIRGRYCISASNVAKYDGWHGLVIFDDPHPLRFGREQLRDFIDVALRWIAAAHAQDSAAIYPIITWNCLPKSGATLMHGHIQIALARGMHYAKFETWRRAAEHYRATSGASYFADFLALHTALDLAIPLGNATHAVAHITPMRNREIVFTHPAVGTGGLPNLGELADALAVVLRRLIDNLGTRTFNLAIALPPIGPAEENWSEMPIIARIGDRGDPLTNRNDVGAMELFAAGCITADPFEVAAQLQTADKQTSRQGDGA
jgi:galactose-1-phosphate uridylyltransferase